MADRVGVLDDAFILDLTEAIKKARRKFPGRNLTIVALAEEFGELAKASMDEGKGAVWKEAVQVAVMAMRMATEGDHSVEYRRAENGLEAITRDDCMPDGKSLDRLEFGGALRSIARERERQVLMEGFNADHDSHHYSGELAIAGSWYALNSICYGKDFVGIGSVQNSLSNHFSGEHSWCKWPFDDGWWKPSNRRADLVKAAALIAADIDRLDRAQLDEDGGRDNGRSC